jgi:tRNA dimethylallyltransferase
VPSPLIAVVGPTGAGKSALALQIARKFRGEIVNCDSLQMYRGFDIGSAKTPEDARQGVPHHMFDALPPTRRYSAGEFAREARAVLGKIATRGRLPVVVGGTGFYLRALLDGLPQLPEREETLRARLEARESRRPGSLHRLLSRLEPDAARRIHPRDVQKLIRALEIRILTGSGRPPQSAAQPLEGFRVLQIGLSPDRELLKKALRERTLQMFREGLVEEVRGLLAQGLTGDEKPFESLGYKQALAHIRGELTLKQAIESTEIETRQYAKRQRTWFRRDSRIHWLDGFGYDPAVVEQAEALVRKFLDK